MPILTSIAGMALILLIAFGLSTGRRNIKLRVVGAAFALQAGIAIIVLYIPAGKRIIEAMAFGVSNLLGYASAGTNFIFGPLADPSIGGNSFAIAAL
ncbi:MAG: Na+ dependent nucleoside transporter N-terminal domain-containing protein, partial [Parasphingorhabdus sp.]